MNEMNLHPKKLRKPLKNRDDLHNVLQPFHTISEFHCVQLPKEKVDRLWLPGPHKILHATCNKELLFFMALV
jgi:hypothetical protein